MPVEAHEIRRWRHVEGFPDINFVEWDGAQVYLVHHSGRRQPTKTYSLTQCEEFARQGIWEEWSEPEGENPEHAAITVAEAGRRGGIVRKASMGPQGFAILGRKGGAALAAKIGPEGFAERGRRGGKARAEQLGKEGMSALGKQGAQARARQPAANRSEELDERGE